MDQPPRISSGILCGTVHSTRVAVRIGSGRNVFLSVPRLTVRNIG